MLDPLNAFLGVARMQEFEAGDGAVAVERNQQIIRAGVTDEIVCLRRGCQEATDASPWVSVTKYKPRSKSRSWTRLAEGKNMRAFRMEIGVLRCASNHRDCS
ncbi:MAG: hypothetical protein ABI651_09685 [Verrucomicrobiota bacterium]